MTRSTRLALVLLLNALLIAALVLVGLTAHSVGVLAEGVDYLADAAAIGVALAAMRVRERHPRALAVAALVNAGWLLVLTVLVIVGATVRLATGVHEVHGTPVLIVSGVAAVVMIGGVVILGGDVDDGDDGDDDDSDLTMRAVVLDTAADAAAAAAVAVTGGVITATNGTYWLDPVVALVVGAVIAYHATRLLAKVLRALQ